ncbi:MAG: tetratricopeptide repeat protein [Candidatus Sedimenticola sp. 6PFRAG5]
MNRNLPFAGSDAVSAAHRNYERAFAQHARGQLKEAESSYKKAIKLKPDFAEAQNNLGNVFRDQQRWKEAVRSYRLASKIYPDNPLILNNLGNALYEIGELTQAEKLLKKALAIEPKYAEAHSNLGNVLRELGRSGDAVSCFEEAIGLNPLLAECYGNLGGLLISQRKITQATAVLKRALERNLVNPQILKNLGIAHAESQDTANAALYFEKALEISTEDSDLWYLLGLQRVRSRDYLGAQPAFEKACQHAPDDLGSMVMLHHCYQYLCNWEALEKLSPRFEKLFSRMSKDVRLDLGEPFAALSRNDDPRDILSVGRSRSRMVESAVAQNEKAFQFADKRKQKKKLRIAYLSNDYYDHPTMHLFRGVLREHDRDRVEIIAYSYWKGPTDEVQDEVAGYCDKFVDISDKSDLECAELIYQDDIDILVDLKGYTKGSRLEICAFRPAPVQVTYLGFPGTSGAGFFDYVLTDKVVTPLEHAPFYTEKLAFLPDTYQSTDNMQASSELEVRRSDYGLPDNAYVFSSFNQTFKLDPDFFSVWMRVLSELEGSVLWLFSSDEAAINNIRHAAASRGVAPDRIVFAGRVSKAEHLSRLKLADMALDTRIYNGHTTTSDALWAGVPVIAMEGRHFASRVSSSLLQSVGLPELVAHDLNGYESLILHYAMHPEELGHVRKKLEINRLSMPLFNTATFTRNLEKAYQEMWDRFASGKKPDHIDVAQLLR